MKLGSAQQKINGWNVWNLLRPHLITAILTLNFSTLNL
jgi:hypothetical protein